MSESFSWQTSDGIEIYGAHWPHSDPQAVIGIVHGVSEHIHRYDHVAAYFVGKGIAVMGYDRQGSGRSGGKRGHVTQGRKGLVDEIAYLHRHMEETYPGKPLFLYGHSMGGNLTLNYIFRRHPSLRGAVISAPQITLAFEPPAWKMAMAKWMGKIYPRYTDTTDLDLTALSRDPKVAEAYRTDPLVNTQITAAAANTIFAAADWLDQYDTPVATPLLLMHGTADRITNADGTRRLAERLVKNVTYKAWDDFYHELHNEPEQQEVLDFVHAWLEWHILNPPQG